MKSNLKEKIKDRRKKSKVITKVNFNKEKTEIASQMISDAWKDEIKNFKSQEFSSVEDVKNYIIGVILEKQNMVGNKEAEEFLQVILDSDIEVETVLNDYVKK